MLPFCTCRHFMLLARRVEAGRDHRFSGIFEPAVPLYASAYCHFMGKGTRINDLLHRTGDSDVQVALKMAFSCRRTHAPTRRLHPASRGFSRMLENSSETTNAL